MGYQPKFTAKSLRETSALDGDNALYLEQCYAAYQQNPLSVSPALRILFETELKPSISVENRGVLPASVSREGLDKTQAFRAWVNAFYASAYRFARFNPLVEPLQAPLATELEPSYYGLHPQDAFLYAGELLSISVIQGRLSTLYLGSVGLEIGQVRDPQEQAFLHQTWQTLNQAPLDPNLKQNLLAILIRTEGLERYLGTQYPGAKRFSLEGSDTLMVALDELIRSLADTQAEELIIGMAHRGRLNVLVNLMGKQPDALFNCFEGKTEALADQSGDVKYHEGFSSDIKVGNKAMHLSLAFNPSHLEIVCPVVLGSVRARQDRRARFNKDSAQAQVVPILIHGDAAFSGQGVVMETFNMAKTRGFGVGGSLHLIVNNQIGFTTSHPEDMRSTPYCSDLAKMFDIPVLHVNGDDPEAVYKVAQLAVKYRQQFHRDIVIDLVSYRRHGHNEADEPAATQPLLYQHIRQKPTVAQQYAKQLVSEKIISETDLKLKQTAYRDSLDKRAEVVAPHVVQPSPSELALRWQKHRDASKDKQVVETGLGIPTLKKWAETLFHIPETFMQHPRVRKIYFDRQEMTAEKAPLDWGYAELLAYASLLQEGYGLRLSGQDVNRGTFFHRHALLHDFKTGETLSPLARLKGQTTQLSIVDSLLSEMAVMGFEYGYACTDPDTLVIWEGQFGDFANGAQVVIDQFVSSGEKKWGRLSGLTLFLPHGYEGQGPEHSSARLERYLQLCAENNMQVCVPSTPAQMFHLIRRQMHNKTRWPLIVLTPKSLLRHRMAVSLFSDLAKPAYETVIVDPLKNTETVERLIFCSGKVYYDIKAAVAEAKLEDTVGLVRLEQLYPFPKAALSQLLQHFPRLKIGVWCQEEPRNQGAFQFVRAKIKTLLKDRPMVYAGRPESAAPAVGSQQLHEAQQAALIQDALFLKAESSAIHLVKKDLIHQGQDNQQGNKRGIV